MVIWLLPKESGQHWMPCFERISGETQSRFEWHLKCSDLPSSCDENAISRVKPVFSTHSRPLDGENPRAVKFCYLHAVFPNRRVSNSRTHCIAASPKNSQIVSPHSKSSMHCTRIHISRPVSFYAKRYRPFFITSPIDNKVIIHRKAYGYFRLSVVRCVTAKGGGNNAKNLGIVLPRKHQALR